MDHAMNEIRDAINEVCSRYVAWQERVFQKLKALF